MDAVGGGAAWSHRGPCSKERHVNTLSVTPTLNLTISFPRVSGNPVSAVPGRLRSVMAGSLELVEALVAETARADDPGDSPVNIAGVARLPVLALIQQLPGLLVPVVQALCQIVHAQHPLNPSILSLLCCWRSPPMRRVQATGPSTSPACSPASPQYTGVLDSRTTPMCAIEEHTV